MSHRIEAGIPWFGLDMDENTLPIEAGLEKSAISFNKGCYIGQESVARITYRGHVNRKLVGLRLSGSQPASKGDKISKDGHEVGWVTSSAYSPNLKTAIALGYLRREVLEPGTAVIIEHGDERCGCGRSRHFHFPSCKPQCLESASCAGTLAAEQTPQSIQIHFENSIITSGSRLILNPLSPLSSSFASSRFCPLIAAACCIRVSFDNSSEKSISSRVTFFPSWYTLLVFTRFP